MSKARLVITAVTAEGLSQGEAVFEPRSRWPKTSPDAISDETVQQPLTFCMPCTAVSSEAVLAGLVLAGQDVSSV